jgi:pyridoxal phosphate enzyme (YggS family)
MIKQNLEKIKQQLPSNVQLVVVSKFRPIEQLKEVYESGEREFAENRVQEMVTKYEALPKDINWHLIGHLQTNKVKYIAPFVSLIHSVDSLELAQEISKQALKNNRIIPILLQVHVAQEDSKFGLKPEMVETVCKQIIELPNVKIKGVMGMATFTEDEILIKKEFRQLKGIFDDLKETNFKNEENFNTVSMGMSGDYELAVWCLSKKAICYIEDWYLPIHQLAR